MKTLSMAAGLIVGVLACASGVLAQADPKDPPATPPTDPAPQPAEPPKQEENLVYYRMVTSMGDIVLELNAEKAPISTKNFGSYVDKGHYNGLIFHRVISNFMIQGGGFTPDMKQRPADKGIKNEWQNGLKNKKGTIAMARQGGQADSGTCQFFINVQDNDMLDTPRDGSGYAVFGKVVSGMDVVEKIRTVKTTSKPPHADVPVEPVTIEKVSKITKEEAESAGKK